MDSELRDSFKAINDKLDKLMPLVPVVAELSRSLDQHSDTLYGPDGRDGLVVDVAELKQSKKFAFTVFGILLTVWSVLVEAVLHVVLGRG